LRAWKNEFLFFQHGDVGKQNEPILLLLFSLLPPLITSSSQQALRGSARGASQWRHISPHSNSARRHGGIAASRHGGALPLSGAHHTPRITKVT